MRENRLYSSEGGENNLPYPYAFSALKDDAYFFLSKKLFYILSIILFVFSKARTPQRAPNKRIATLTSGAALVRGDLG
jgi:hypothetical protein